MKLSKEAIERLAGEEPFFISFFKKNGEHRKLYGKLDISPYLKNQDSLSKSRNNKWDDNIYTPTKVHKPIKAFFAKDGVHLLADDLENKGLRQINMEKVYMFVQGGVRLVDTEMESLFKEDEAHNFQEEEAKMAVEINKRVFNKPIIKTINTE